MPGHYFISYSDADGKDFALRLHDALESTADVLCWLDKLDLAGGGKWSSSIPDAIRDCQLVLFVMTRDSIRDNNTCQQELLTALKYKKPIVPLRLHKVDLPFLINTRQWLDFTGDFGVGMARLREHIRWRATPAAALQDLTDRLKDAERDLDRATDPTDRARIQADLDLLTKQIAEQQRIVADPAAAAKRTEASIAAGLERERAPAEPISGRAKTKFINPPPMTAPRYFQDRHIENRRIADFLRDESKRMLTINGRAGIGKTAMVCRILKSLESGHLPDDLGEMSVDGIIYLSAIGTRTINVPNLFADLCQLLPAEIGAKLDALYRDPKISPHAKMLALLEKFPSGCVVVLLDNFESVIDATDCCVKDAELDEALCALLNAPHHAVKIILTTRIPPRELELFQPGSQAYLPVDAGLEASYAKQLLREMDADRRVGLKNADDAILQRACDRTRGFPRALEALYTILAADRYTSLEEILGTSVETLHATSLPTTPQPLLPENVVEALVGEAFSRLDPTAQRVMQALAVYARPVTPAAVDYLLQPFSASVDSAPVLNRLVNMQFAHRESGKYYLHPTDRDYAFGKVKSEKAKGKSEEADWTQNALLTRAADYFAQTRKPRETWKTLADLEPQLNEFDLRNAAEDCDTAASVLLEIDYDYLLLWGHYRLMIEMHERLQGKIFDAHLKGNSAGNLGSAYYSIGQAQNAIAWYENALAFAREAKNRGGESAWLGNLGNCYAALGQTQRAIEFHEQALAIAREIGDKRGEGVDLGSLGNAYAALGQTQRAIEFYEQALAIAREIGDKQGEGADLGNLGNRYAELGQTRRAIEFHEQALAIAREIGDKRGEGADLGNLGNRYADLGETQRAIEFYEQALAIAREIGDRAEEARDLGRLGSCYATLGKTNDAIRRYKQSLAIAREIGDRLEECVRLGKIADRYTELAQYARATEYYEDAIRIAREIESKFWEGNWLGDMAILMIDQGDYSNAINCAGESLKLGDTMGAPVIQNWDHATLALAHLYAGNIPAARAAAEAAHQYNEPQNNHNVLALLGIIALRQNDRAAAQEAFTAAIAHADVMLERSAQYYDALDAKGVALCGLGLCGRKGEAFVSLDSKSKATVSSQNDSPQRLDSTNASPLQAAVAAFRAARAINKDAGIVGRVVRLLDALALADPQGAEKLAEARKTVIGD